MGAGVQQRAGQPWFTECFCSNYAHLFALGEGAHPPLHGRRARGGTELSKQRWDVCHSVMLLRVLHVVACACTSLLLITE